MAAVDSIQNGHYASNEYAKPVRSVVVIADGAQVIQPADLERGAEVASLVRYLREYDKGPLVGIDEEHCLGWFWVDSAESEKRLRDCGVADHFQMVTYAGAADGRQSAKVDSKIQSLIRRCISKAVRLSRGGQPVHSLSVVLLSGDGDHSVHLWSGVLQFLLPPNLRTRSSTKDILIDRIPKEKRVDVWIVGRDSATISQKLRRFTPGDEIASLPPAVVQELSLRVSVKCRCPKLSKGQTDMSQEEGGDPLDSLERRFSLERVRVPTLGSFVDTVFPYYESEQFNRLLNNRGLHAFLDASWGGVQDTKVFIIDGVTGSGKSTQIPQMLYDMLSFKEWAGVGPKVGRKPRIICTQPRRIACESIASHVAAQRQSRTFPWDDTDDRPVTSQSKTVGYHIAGRKHCSSETPIVYCTAGILLQQLAHNRSEPWDVVILDEVHERSVEYDLVLAMLLLPETLIPGRSIVIMSATLQGMSQELQSYITRRVSKGGGGRMWLDDSRFIKTFDITTPVASYEGYPAMADTGAFSNYQEESGGGRFDIDVHYLDDLRADHESGRKEIVPRLRVRNWDNVMEWKPQHRRGRRDGQEGREDARVPAIWQERFDCAKNLVAALVEQAVEADEREVVIVFLPGLSIMRDMETHISTLPVIAGLPEARRPPVSILHGQMGHEKQQEAMQSTAPVRVVLSTNVGESSITIADATAVVDLCLVKQSVSSVDTEKRLDFSPAAKDSCQQRKGRVGRVRAGKCFRVITKKEWEARPALRVAEMTRCSLDLAILSVLNRFEGKDTAIKDPVKLLETCMSPPDPGEVERTLQFLRETHAIRLRDDVSCPHELCPFGRIMNILSLSVNTALFVIWASIASPELGMLAADYAAIASLSSDLIRDPTDCDMNPQPARLFVAYGQRAAYMTKWALLEGVQYNSDIVMQLNLLNEFRRIAAGAGEPPSKWCKKRFLNYQGLCEVEEKAAEVRRKMHRYRPLFPELPSDTNALTLVDVKAVKESLRTGYARLSNRNAPTLLFLHAAVCTRSAVSAIRMPQTMYAVAFEVRSEDSSSAARMARGMRTVMSHLRPSIEINSGEGAGKEIGLNFSITGQPDRSTRPATIVKAAQFDHCWRTVVKDSCIKRVNMAVAEYGFSLSPARGEETIRNVMVVPSSLLNPMVVPVAFGDALLLYPTQADCHQNRTDPKYYTRVCTGVTALTKLTNHSEKAVHLPAVLHATFDLAGGSGADGERDTDVDRMIAGVMEKAEGTGLAQAIAEVKRVFVGQEAVNEHFIFDMGDDFEGEFEDDLEQRAFPAASPARPPGEMLTDLLCRAVNCSPGDLYKFFGVAAASAP
eukprot:TRINITY_DN5433_c0_g1_i1.p1 TRINITY_DN5433_c0_g1~~TRINITY_DN5433_c0_g1_i1.p1  ORF type:complete len:1330 (+),score=351.66 TRINITY_DN5433_c0_g1_i1:71-4060(+)